YWISASFARLRVARPVGRRGRQTSVAVQGLEEHEFWLVPSVLALRTGDEVHCEARDIRCGPRRGCRLQLSFGLRSNSTLSASSQSVPADSYYRIFRFRIEIDTILSRQRL